MSSSRSRWRVALLAPLYGLVTLAALALLHTLLGSLQALYAASEILTTADHDTGVDAPDVAGRVIRVSDGDTFVLETSDKVRLVVRVAEIDAPEQGQPYGSQSKKALSKLVRGREVQLVVQTTDSYGRAVARPYVDGADVSSEMIASGAAWVYRRYLRDNRLAALEAQAKAARRGLWRLPAAERRPPWEWRRSHPRR